MVIGTIALAAYLIFFYKEDKSSKTKEKQP